MSKEQVRVAGAPPPGAGAPPLDRAVFVRPIAHRGLHAAASGRIENSAPAFQAAIAKGYGIECDLQAAEDGTPMVFHDTTLERLIDATGPIAYRTPRDLALLRYRGLDSGILSLGDLLELVAGHVPLLIEVKSTGGTPVGFLERIAAAAGTYGGPLALMSFDRQALAMLAAAAPGVPRGLLAGTHQLPARLWPARRPLTARDLDTLLGPVPAGVAFYALDVRMLEPAAEWVAAHAPQLPRFAWTVRTPAELETARRWADAPIFEGFEL
jgi:glycerophosphoryl diester phosphodiesterase